MGKKPRVYGRHSSEAYLEIRGQSQLEGLWNTEGLRRCVEANREPSEKEGCCDSEGLHCWNFQKSNHHDLILSTAIRGNLGRCFAIGDAVLQLSQVQFTILDSPHTES